MCVVVMQYLRDFSMCYCSIYGVYVIITRLNLELISVIEF